mmetsp:Transcript_2424/g.5504  ORF Transcript_2424/g.5504 Transcript_2424/m.5504 type:complete len:218 (-) Transcript_2424:325-978(-)
MARLFPPVTRPVHSRVNHSRHLTQQGSIKLTTCPKTADPTPSPTTTAAKRPTLNVIHTSIKAKSMPVDNTLNAHLSSAATCHGTRCSWLLRCAASSVCSSPPLLRASAWCRCSCSPTLTTVSAAPLPPVRSRGDPRDSDKPSLFIEWLLSADVARSSSLALSEGCRHVWGYRGTGEGGSVNADLAGRSALKWRSRRFLRYFRYMLRKPAAKQTRQDR